ncbi:hypothetical protein JMJ77_0004536 [Colletotrichum scovillei]|uniref:Uncharacterized protein n=1 Tax=Colletotrichum scovillei TaxID=1209932 RepID=A0A9P7UGQ5_9PEZI|nr:hypothetical protein JMJ77_0004536 [Colletotrichum scovillei]KAG7075744.1 hypothetical protein JMJ76_0013021 [Colletotrichum scovillei]KAG7082867.1 hypothetical protein JMJ78_0008321 [Colletotrichum scovillei]
MFLRSFKLLDTLREATKSKDSG